MFRTFNYILNLILIIYFNQIQAETKLPLVINTWAFEEANEAAWAALQQGDTALDALVIGCTTCEEQQCDGTVGYGGSPDENGETTLDAMLIDGSNMNIGAVAALRQIKSATKVARVVLEHTKHTLLVGDAASNFAEMMGFRRESLTTPKSKQIWQEWRDNHCQPNFWLNVIPDATQQCGPYKPHNRWQTQDLNERYSYKVDQWHHDTIGMIVIDSQGHIYAGTSTNGASHKIPGRVGDSPIPGAGAYADNEVGAAVATGDGDVMMRFLPSLLAVEFLRSGFTPEEAAAKSMSRIVRYYPDFSGGLVVTDRWGNYSTACVGLERFPFSVAYGQTNTKVEYKECLQQKKAKRSDLK
ncbi:putative N(4)-(beta-N-acetylglucosaminyl)-L-asparaginase GG24090 [Lucilia sericata]|uniref:putative N(4)-(beta-N-acetylglucosaminyl)-L-asparaginase GG24090 n=1 Tax=Lucilia sericata TaxID=13632 RepID=UPI0018A8244D|nr:putative N(4)-(beta-N-acetylglucosaminyl)-L-asparaginase GG24090 [Lucilia sericata]